MRQWHVRACSCHQRLARLVYDIWPPTSDEPVFKARTCVVVACGNLLCARDHTAGHFRRLSNDEWPSRQGLCSVIGLGATAHYAACSAQSRYHMPNACLKEGQFRHNLLILRQCRIRKGFLVVLDLDGVEIEEVIVIRIGPVMGRHTCKSLRRIPRYVDSACEWTRCAQVVLARSTFPQSNVPGQGNPTGFIFVHEEVGFTCNLAATACRSE